MRKLLLITTTLAAFGFMFVACGGAADAPTEPASIEVPPDPAPAPEPAEPAADEGGGGGPCEAYAACCEAYAEALGGVEGIPEASVTATKDSCTAIEGLKAMPTAGDACQQSFDALKMGMDAYKAMPGFEVPGACQ